MCCVNHTTRNAAPAYHLNAVFCLSNHNINKVQVAIHKELRIPRLKAKHKRLLKSLHSIVFLLP
jgi:hypothetical protein